MRLSSLIERRCGGDELAAGFVLLGCPAISQYCQRR